MIPTTAPLRQRTCFVPGCRSGYASDKRANKLAGESNPRLFKAPTDPTYFKKWNEAIGRKDKTLESSSVVCSLHFKKHEILWFYETKMPDGTINKIERGKPALLDWAIPSIFSNFSSSRKRQNPLRIRTQATEVKKIKSYHSKGSKSPNVIEGNSSDQSENDIATASLVSVKNEKNALFECLRDRLEKIFEIPNRSWSGTFLPERNEIILAQWDGTYTTKKEIILHDDMSYKVLIGTAKVRIRDEDAVIRDYNDLEDVIRMVDKIEVSETITIS